MSETKKGKISKISKFKGIVFEGEEDWYNPVEKCKEFVKDEYKGKEVEITLVEGKGNKFSYIKTTDGKIPLPETTKEYPRQSNYYSNDRLEFDIKKHKEIRRNGLLNTANEIIKNTINLTGKQKEITADQMADLTIEITKKLELFVTE